MRSMKCGLLTAAAAALVLLVPAKPSHAQISIGVNIGAAPECPYGYYDYSPYSCAPYGYYGPEWFNGGAFIGAGPWFHGPSGFHGHVDNHYDPHHGYHGAMPKAHEKPMANRGPAPANFHGNESRDGHGHAEGKR
jgi:hypothetical protein